uniref:Uncharacterized protein n=1 Tax=Arundo donax TaxID=35708 RepID=A0A0A9FAA6_ARUDO
MAKWPHRAAASRWSRVGGLSATVASICMEPHTPTPGVRLAVAASVNSQSDRRLAATAVAIATSSHTSQPPPNAASVRQSHQSGPIQWWWRGGEDLHCGRDRCTLHRLYTRATAETLA